MVCTAQIKLESTVIYKNQNQLLYAYIWSTTNFPPKTTRIEGVTTPLRPGTAAQAHDFEIRYIPGKLNFVLNKCFVSVLR